MGGSLLPWVVGKISALLEGYKPLDESRSFIGVLLLASSNTLPVNFGVALQGRTSRPIDCLV
jgi:hypothetical protein